MIIIVMGVSGSGKTTIGRLLASRLNIPFYDADDFHPEVNIEKMGKGIPLNDTDRRPWLEVLGANIRLWDQQGGAVLACSALKEHYRAVLRAVPHIHWIYLSGSRSLILSRLESRKGHYMSSLLLNSQIEALEQPAYGIHVDIAGTPELIVKDLLLKLKDMIPASELGLIGLGVMGKSLAINFAEKGVHMAVYNRHVKGREEGIARQLLAANPSLPTLRGFDSLEEFIQSLARPRKVMLMIYAGAVDEQLNELVSLLEPGDVILDGGNSGYKDSARRTGFLASKGIHFVGAGISGGEEGARKGPSIMAGGSERGYVLMAKYLELLAAKDPSGNPCTAYVGPGGAGHFVKMVHNGIEYAEMQLMAEIYSLMKNLLKIPSDDIAHILRDWEKGELGSYLLEITCNILEWKEGGELLLDKIQDQAEHKGTGGLSTAAALEYGVPYSPLSEAVMARFLSAMKAERVEAAALYSREPVMDEIAKDSFLASMKSGYQAARLINHQIGFNLLLQAASHHHWELDISEIARIWTNGCIIRSELMEELSEILKADENILKSPLIVERLNAGIKDLTTVVSQGLQQGFALPVLSAALNYFLAYTTADSTANLIQAQRDYFGAHTYQRRDQPAGQYFHTNWKPD